MSKIYLGFTVNHLQKQDKHTVFCTAKFRFSLSKEADKSVRLFA